MNANHDVIAAIASNPGESAIGIVRMSGQGVLDIFRKIFKTASQITNRFMLYGHIVDPDNGETVDEVMAVFLESPKTYTREDVVEIYCHGGSVSSHRIMSILIRQGARVADPGEFTFRAFINGRIDLTQAESVVDLIKAKTSKTFDCSLKQLSGGTSFFVRELIANLVDLLAHITVCIDYPEEDIEEISEERIRNALEKAISDVEDILKNAEHSRLLSEGIKIAIIGKPNVGKSSLMNLLLGSARAIVTDVPGTTRDTIEETLVIDGYAAKVIDTAGIRETDDIVEQIGVQKAKFTANEADVVIFLLDASSNHDKEDDFILEHLQGREVIVVANKMDLCSCSTWNIGSDSRFSSFVSVSVSVKESPREALEKIRAELTKKVRKNIVSDHAVVNLRHQSLLREARAILKEALCAGQYDLVEVDIRQAISVLGKITGDNVSSEILDAIFSKFCLGK